MKFICDVCPTNVRGQTVIEGGYEGWIRHLLTPKHQTEQALLLKRTSYWPDAKWIVKVKNVPDFTETTVELHVDLCNNLSEYGVIEAVYYGKKLDCVLLAMQLYETKVVPRIMKGPLGIVFEIKVEVKSKQPADKENELPLNDKAVGRRRFDHGKPEPCQAFSPPVSPLFVGSTPGSKEMIVGGDVVSEPRKTYDRETLLKLRRSGSALPARFVEILDSPIADVIKQESLMQTSRMQEILSLFPDMLSGPMSSMPAHPVKARSSPMPPHAVPARSSQMPPHPVPTRSSQMPPHPVPTRSSQLPPHPVPVPVPLNCMQQRLTSSIRDNQAPRAGNENRHEPGRFLRSRVLPVDRQPRYQNRDAARQEPSFDAMRGGQINA